MKKLIFTLLSIMSCTALFAAVPAKPVLLDATRAGNNFYLSEYSKDAESGMTVSYTHLTLPTICSV